MGSRRGGAGQTPKGSSWSQLLHVLSVAWKVVGGVGLVVGLALAVPEAHERLCMGTPWWRSWGTSLGFDCAAYAQKPSGSVSASKNDDPAKELVSLGISVSPRDRDQAFLNSTKSGDTRTILLLTKVGFEPSPQAIKAAMRSIKWSEKMRDSLEPIEAAVSRSICDARISKDAFVDYMDRLGEAGWRHFCGSYRVSFEGKVRDIEGRLQELQKRLASIGDGDPRKTRDACEARLVQLENRISEYSSKNGFFHSAVSERDVLSSGAKSSGNYYDDEKVFIRENYRPNESAVRSSWWMNLRASGLYGKEELAKMSAVQAYCRCKYEVDLPAKRKKLLQDKSALDEDLIFFGRLSAVLK